MIYSNSKEPKKGVRVAKLRKATLVVNLQSSGKCTIVVKWTRVRRKASKDRDFRCISMIYNTYQSQIPLQIIDWKQCWQGQETLKNVRQQIVICDIARRVLWTKAEGYVYHTYFIIKCQLMGKQRSMEVWIEYHYSLR